MDAPSKLHKNRSILIFVLSYIVTYIGDGIFYVASALFFISQKHIPVTTYGAVLSVSWTITALTSTTIGHYIDHKAYKKSVFVFLTISGILVVILTFATKIYVIMILIPLFSICTQGTKTARTALINQTFPPHQVTRVRSIFIVASNLGLAVGSMIGSLALIKNTSNAFHIEFLLDALSFLLCGILILFIPVTQVSQIKEKKTTQSFINKFSTVKDIPYLLLSISNLLLSLHVVLIDLALPIWIVEKTTAPHWTIAALFFVNTMVVALLQYNAAKKIISLDYATQNILYAGILLFIAMLVYGLSGFFKNPIIPTILLLLGTFILTLGEIRQIASLTELSFRLVHAEKYGEYQGLFNSGSALAEAIGPVLLTTILLNYGLTGWTILGSVLLMGAILANFSAKLAKKSILKRECFHGI